MRLRSCSSALGFPVPGIFGEVVLLNSLTLCSNASSSSRGHVQNSNPFPKG